MKNYSLVIIFTLVSTLLANAQETLIYHRIKTDPQGKIVPWYHPDPGTSYDHVIHLVWNFWDHIRTDPNGLPYYMNHQVWNPNFNDIRGIGGDQISMALSSWRLYYHYTGNERVKANMYFMADYNLSHGLSPAHCKWPNIPFPYNTLVYSGIYDGDMRCGRGVTQPDKAGSFGYELLQLYKMSSGYNVNENTNYLNGAIDIANTLAEHVRPGNNDYSPLPFKVNVFTGETALLRDHDFTHTWIDTAGYTSNWAPTLMLFEDLIALKKGNTAQYQRAFDTILQWMKDYPMKTNKWGPFFEDVDWWSETQINAMTFARYVMEHPQHFEHWQSDVQKIVQHVHTTFGNNKWQKYGVFVTNEQSVYQMPAQSHSSRQAADELLYVRLTNDSTWYQNAVRELNWATYTVDVDGKNKFPGDEPWLTDGYGDYVRHYLRAMNDFPNLAPSQNRILGTTSVIQQADYAGFLKKYYGLNFEGIDSSRVRLFYRTFDASGTERIRLKQKPSAVWLEGKPLPEGPSPDEGFEWQKLKTGGLLIVRRKSGRKVIVVK